MEKTDWISVNDRLPELTEQVYWYNDDNERVPWEGRFEIHVLGYDPERGRCMAHYDGVLWSEVAKFGTSSCVNITHWMPLPPEPSTKQ